MEINPTSFLEHIAETTEKTVSEVERAIGLEYWKAMCNFGTYRGIDLFRKYLHAKGITKLKKMYDGWGIEIPMSTIEETKFPREMISLYVGGTYSGVFKRKYEDEFIFGDE